MLTYENWQEPIIDFQVDDMYKAALEVLQWSYQQYGDEIVYACSFGIEGIVLIDLISKVKPNATIVFWIQMYTLKKHMKPLIKSKKNIHNSTLS